MPQKPLDRRRAEWKSSERIRFVKVKSTPYLMVEFNLSKWNFRFQSTFLLRIILVIGESGLFSIRRKIVLRR